MFGEVVGVRDNKKILFIFPHPRQYGDGSQKSHNNTPTDNYQPSLIITDLFNLQRITTHRKSCTTSKQPYLRTITLALKLIDVYGKGVFEETEE